MRAAAIAIGSIVCLAGAARADLLVLKRDGALDRVGTGGGARTVGRFTAPRALAALSGGRIAVLAGGKLEIFDGAAWRPLGGRFDDAAELAACGARLYVAGARAIDEIDLKSGKRRLVREHGQKTPVKIFCGGADRLYLEHDGVVDELAAAPRAAWTIPGRRPRALAADGTKIYAATRDGPLWEYDFATGAARDLGMGGWWGALALAAEGAKLYAVTQAGKLWQIDPAAAVKTILSMDGWEGALALAVSR